jgi:hypothetical protein
VYVFPDGKGPNQLESNYLRLGGSGLTLHLSVYDLIYLSISIYINLSKYRACSFASRACAFCFARMGSLLESQMTWGLEALEVCQRRWRCANSLAGGGTMPGHTGDHACKTHSSPFPLLTPCHIGHHFTLLTRLPVPLASDLRVEAVVQDLVDRAGSRRARDDDFFLTFFWWRQCKSWWTGGLEAMTLRSTVLPLTSAVPNWFPRFRLPHSLSLPCCFLPFLPRPRCLRACTAPPLPP